MKNLIYASLVSLENILAQIQFTIRLEGMFVEIKFRFSKEHSFMIFKIRYNTFKKLMSRLKKAEEKIDKKFKSEL